MATRQTQNTSTKGLMSSVIAFQTMNTWQTFDNTTWSQTCMTAYNNFSFSWLLFTVSFSCKNFFFFTIATSTTKNGRFRLVNMVQTVLSLRPLFSIPESRHDISKVCSFTQYVSIMTCVVTSLGLANGFSLNPHTGHHTGYTNMAQKRCKNKGTKPLHYTVSVSKKYVAGEQSLLGKAG